ncbi:MAG: hypothetical protein Q8Q52_03500 [Acidimicrobiia bacterium]|nr:hypothetical protein [Acidimicrobiia bacterium]
MTPDSGVVGRRQSRSHRQGRTDQEAAALQLHTRQAVEGGMAWSVEVTGRNPDQPEPFPNPRPVLFAVWGGIAQPCELLVAIRYTAS